jgi:hypothetical protein
MTGHDGGVTYALDDLEVATIVGSTDQRHAWARIVRKGAPHITHYHQDLLWDWVLLRKYWDPAGFTFWYGVRDTGTWMSDNEQLFRQLEAGSPTPNRWKVTVTFYDSGDFRDMTWEDWTP